MAGPMVGPILERPTAASSSTATGSSSTATSCARC
jgi:hypothetical protein